jgi:hypothetical protein
MITDLSAMSIRELKVELSAAKAAVKYWTTVNVNNVEVVSAYQKRVEDELERRKFQTETGN